MAAGIASLAIGIPLMVYGFMTYGSMVNVTSRGDCSLDQSTAGSTCADATIFGVILVLGIVVTGAGIAYLAMSRKSVSKIAV
jgi:hypothetical protein